jgi:hypothetical protein
MVHGTGSLTITPAHGMTPIHGNTVWPEAAAKDIETLIFYAGIPANSQLGRVAL